MIDLTILEQYKENNRIEAKTALGGLPKSIWETYSAFANTLGGVILLGVQEYRDKTFHLVDLPDPDGMKQEFWTLVNDPNTASVNILSLDNIRIENIDGNHIIIIEVPRAGRMNRPVFVDGNPQHTYRRNGEGDYRCSHEEYQAMIRDASLLSQDMSILEEMETSVLCPECIHEYRRQMRIARPGHIWERSDDEEFLLKLGAAAIGGDGLPHPVIGGLLMFGTSENICRIFPNYSLVCYTDHSPLVRREDYISSASRDWSGNVSDFYFRVCSRLRNSLLEQKNHVRFDDGPVFDAIQEALVNCLVNADYYGQSGVRVIKTNDCLKISNPGNFRVDPNLAITGGDADPRNSLLQKMFNLINIGGGNGSGIPNIFRIWKEQGLQEPQIIQKMHPDSTIMTLPFLSADGKQKQFGGTGQLAVNQIKRRMIIDYLTEHIEATVTDLSAYLDMKPSRVKDCLQKLIRDDIVVPEGEAQSRRYKLKS